MTLDSTRRLRVRSALLSLCVTAALLASGGGCSSSKSKSTVTFTVSGTVTGLKGTGLVLQNNLGDDDAIGVSGSFSFATALESGASYSVSVKAQPASPAQTCTVDKGSGTIGAADVSDVAVTCALSDADTRPLSLSLVKLPPNAAMGALVPYTVAEAQGIALTGVTWYSDGAAGGHSLAGLPMSVGQVWNTPGQHTLRAVATASNGRSAEISGTITAVSAPIASGATHTCALTAGGGVLCWGYGGSGNLGDSHSVNQAAPVAVTGLTSGVLGLAAGDGHSCAIKSDRSVVCWGDNTEGQLGNAASFHSIVNTSPVAADGVSDVVALAAGRYHTCALKSDGTVTCFGKNSENELGAAASGSQSATPTAVAGLSSVVAISAGSGYFTCALKADSTVACWGDNESGQLGTGSSSPSQTGTPQLVRIAGGETLNRVLALRSGAHHSCAIVDDGAYSTYCWGDNSYHQISSGAANVVYAATQVPSLTSNLLLTTTMYSSCSVTLRQGFECWGSNDYGESDGTGATGSNVSAPAPIAALQGVALPEYTSGGNEFICALTATGGATCFGRGTDGELGNGGFDTLPTPQTVNVPAATFWTWED